MDTILGKFVSNKITSFDLSLESRTLNLLNAEKDEISRIQSRKMAIYQEIQF